MIEEGPPELRSWLLMAVALAFGWPATGWADAPETVESTSEQERATSVDGERYGFSIEVGALVLARSMQLQVDAQTVEHQPQPYAGAFVKSNVDLADFEEIDATLRLEGEFAYGVARNSDVAPDLGRQPVTQLSMGGGRLGVVRSLSPQWSLFFGLGAHATSFIIEANRTYTGHRYVAGEAALGVDWLGASVPLAAGIDLAALPVLSLNQSSGGYGDGRAFGARAEAYIGWNVLEREVPQGYAGGRVTLRYRYQRYRSVFPDRRIALGGGVSTDQQHGAFVTFGYFL
jgi:hypothetical protein